MQTHVVVNYTDITPYIVDGSYDVNYSDASESWQDGNMVEHRIIVSEKVSGSFQVVCSNRSGFITLEDFLALWNGAVNLGVVTLGCWVLNKGTFEAIECYFEIKNADHILSADGDFIDVLKITIKER